MNRPMPRQIVPALSLPLVGGGTWTLAEQQARHFTMIAFYRGLHCPICKTYLGELNALAADFESRGVGFVAVSSDGAERAAQAKESWNLARVPVAYGLSIEKAREWGLYVSAGRGKTSAGVEEPALFSEPGLFFVRPDGTLFFAAVQTMPFARPHFKDLLPALDFVIKNNYPARGEA